MGLYRRGNVWWTKLKCRGKTIRRSTDTTNITLARRVEQKLLYELASGKWFEVNPADEILFSEAWERYLREDAKFKSKSTYSRALQVGKLIIPFLKDLKLSEVTPSILCSYRAHRLGLGLKPNTVAKELHFVRRVFSLCKREWQVIKQSPFEFFTMPSEDDRRVRYLEPGEIDTLLFHSPAWLKPMLVLARNTGMRRGNILGLTWSEVNMQERVINLERTKNGQRLTIPLNNAAYDVLDGLKNAKIKLLHYPNVCFTWTASRLTLTGSLWPLKGLADALA
ncbi:MAG: site-specific integrase [Deltaproteobacteria bacterium]|nr:site-specific integrase [Deltaproteobacteria bacterium]